MNNGGMNHGNYSRNGIRIKRNDGRRHDGLQEGSKRN